MSYGSETHQTYDKLLPVFTKCLSISRLFSLYEEDIQVDHEREHIDRIVLNE